MLLIMSCSEVKLPPKKDTAPFAEVYNGPMWLQVKASKFPLAQVAAISALHGFMEPGTEIEMYDTLMDAKRSQWFCGKGNHVWRLARAAEAAGGAFMVGGQMYQELGQTALRIEPGLPITFASGSYLQQRKQLGEWLRLQASTAPAR